MDVKDGERGTIQALDGLTSEPTNQQRYTEINHLEWVFVRSQKPFIVAPSFDEGEAARLARRVCQSVDDILHRRPIRTN